MLDITVFPLALDNGQEKYDLPGLLVVAAPRKSERMRAQDLLVLYVRLITSTGVPAAITPAQQKEILSNLAQAYFSSAGSVTTGLRETVNRLNDFLFKRNLHAAHEEQAIGELTLAAVHGQSLIIAHAGAAHSFFLSKDFLQHYDDSQGNRALGLSRQAAPRFYQSSVEPGDMLVLCPDPPQAWSRSLAGSPQLSLDHVRRRLVSEAGSELQVATLRFSAGKGIVTTWRPAERGTAAAQPAPATAPAASKAEPAAPKAEPASSTGKPADQKPEPALAKGQPAAPKAGILKSGFQLPKIHFGPFKPAAAPASTPPPQPSPKEHSPARTASASSSAQAGSGPGPAAEKPAAGSSTAAGSSGAAGSSTAASSSGAAGSSTAASSSGAAATGSRPTGQGAIFLGGANAPNAAASSSTPAPRPARNVPGSAAGSSTAAGSSSAATSGGAAGSPSAAGSSTAATSHGAAGSPIAAAAVKNEPAPLRTGARPGGDPAAARQETVQPSPRAPSFFNKLQGQLTAAWDKAQPARDKLAGDVVRRATRVMPKKNEPLFNLSPALLMFIAILVPIIVVAVATTVYFRAGRYEQFKILSAQAQQYADQAEKQPDPALAKEGWTSAFKLITEAEKYGKSDQSTALHRKALDGLDNLQGIVRLNFQSISTDRYGGSVKITRIVAGLNQIYLLDASQGRVLSMTRVTSGGFEANQYFNCTPGKAGGAIIGQLIDIVPLPVNNQMGAEIMGIDAGGNLVYCASGKTGFDSQTLALPDQGWGKIVTVTAYEDTLFVLDPLANAVYRYDGDKGMFAQKPHLYFDNEIPNLKDVIDMAVDQEFLYLLHANGSMTVCSSGGVSYGNTRCTDPAPYGDPRTGYDPAPQSFPGSRFIQLQTTQPPDPSLFALDAVNHSIYHLSQRRLNFQREYRQVMDADYPFPNQAPTAFAVTPNRRLIIAFDDRVFFAPLP